MKTHFQFIFAIFFLLNKSVFSQCSTTVAITANSTPTGCGVRILTANTSGNAWTQKTDVPAPQRRLAVGFSIGSKGYMGTGSTGYHITAADFWEYDPATNAWTQKMNFPGTSREGAVGFGIGTKGYLGSGHNYANSTYFNDFWEYDPAANTWTAKNAFPGTARIFAAGFSLNGKGYVGTGVTSTSSYLNDFWEYNPVSDTWSARANFAGTSRFSSVGMAIGAKGYIGLGYTTAGTASTDFWEFDPVGNSWLQKPNMGTVQMEGASCFAIGNYGYVAGGYIDATGTATDKLWIYDQANNNWAPGSPMGATNANFYAFAFSIGSKGYVGSGDQNSGLSRFFEYEPTGSFAWSNGATTKTITALGSTTYSVFATTVNGCTATASQTVALAANPTITVNSAAFTCPGTSNTLVASGATTYTWSANAGGVVSSSAVVAPSVLTTYTVSGTSGSCTVNFPVSLNMYAAPVTGISASGPTVGCGNITLTAGAWGNTWTQRSSLNVYRESAVGFSIGTKGYIGTGDQNNWPYYLSDFWEFDPANNSWTQKADFGGGPRYGAVGFSIGSKGYIGTGNDGSTLKNDFWEYDPSLNTWTQKANVGAATRTEATGFELNGKGYIGTGFNGNYLTDFWAYDPLADTWTQKTDFTGTGRYRAASFSCNGKGYLGTGETSTNSYNNDFWQYDPASNAWTAKNTFPGGGAQRIAGLSIGSKGYFAMGLINANRSNTLWEYTPTSDSWIQKANFGGGIRDRATGFVIGNRAYVGTGYNSLSYTSDLWQYDQSATVLWSTTSTLSAITTSLSGSYSVTLTNLAGCSSIASQSVFMTPVPTVAVSGPSTALCAGNAITFTAGGATNYTWSSNAGSVTTGTVSVYPFSNSTYTVTGAVNSCTASAVKSLTVTNQLPTVTAAVSNTSVCQGSSVTFTGSGASTYTWSSGVTNNTAYTPSATNDYTVTGTDLNTCTNTAVVSVTVKPSPTVTVNSGTICAGQSFSLSPTGGVTYTYSSGSALVSPSGTTSYSITGFNAIGCPNFIPVVATVTVNALPVIAANSTVICIGTSYAINPTGASTYTYSGGAVVSPTVNTSYSVTGTSTAGCISQSATVLNVTVAPLPPVSVSSGTICSGQSFFLNPGGASTYAYSNGGAALVSPTANASYSVSGISAYGCISSSFAVAGVTVLASPTVIVNSGSICAGQSFSLSPTGGITYTYSGGSALVSPSGTGTTSYSVTGFNAIGCPNTPPAIATVTVYALPVVVANSTIICTGSSYVINPTGAFTFTYSGGAVVSPTSNATYSVTGTSTAGCVTQSATVLNVTVVPLPTVSVSSGTFCSGLSFSLNPTGASTYSYSNGGSAIVSPTLSTSYSVTGTSIYGCITASAAVANLTVLVTPTVTVNSGSICVGQTFTLLPAGANSYTYQGGSAFVSPAVTGTYAVTGSSVNGCASQSSAIATVTVYVLPVISASSGSICAGSSYTIVPGGAVTYTFQGGSPVVSPAASSNYSVSGTSSAGCVAASPAITSITVNALPVISVNNGTICSGESFVMLPSGASTYTYSSGSATVTPSAGTSYSVTGTSTAGCVSAIQAVSHVSVLITPSLVLTPSAVVCAGTAYTIQPTGAFTYTYSGGSNIVTPSASGSYTVSGSSAQGCPGNTVVISLSVQPSLTMSISGPTLICQGQSITLNASGASSYTWNSGVNGNSITASPVTAFVFSVNGSSASCTGSASHSVQVGVPPVFNITLTNSVLCAGETGTIYVSGASNYLWSNGSTSTAIVVTPGATEDYTITGSSPAGCFNRAVVTQSVSDCLGIGVINAAADVIHVYPNPNNGVVTIETGLLYDEAVIELCDNMGRVVLSREMHGLFSDLDYSAMANGLYVLRIKTKGKCVLNAKLIKQ